jgi:YHS domain-containing protein
MCSGNDLVLALEKGRTVKGKPQHGINLKGRIFLFASDDSRRKFMGDPNWYLSRAIDQSEEMNEEPVVRPEYESSDYALDGYCPVTLVEDSRWKQGNRDFAGTRDCRTFLFADADHQKRFREQPDLYMPAFLGNDVVIAKEEGRIAKGKRRHGVFYRNRIFLFASEDSIRKFNKVPLEYLQFTDGKQEAEVIVRPEGEFSDLEFNVPLSE